MLFQTGIALSLLVFTQMLAINSFYQEHIWSLWTLPDLTIKSRNSPPSAVLFSLNYFRQRLVASVPPPVLADSRLLVPRRPFLPALSAQQTCCCCCGCPDILQPLLLFCCCTDTCTLLCGCSDALLTLLLLLLASRYSALPHSSAPDLPNRQLIFEQRHSKPALQEVWGRGPQLLK